MSKQEEIAARRSLVAELTESGFSQRQLAHMFSVTPRTIARDRKGMTKAEKCHTPEAVPKTVQSTCPVCHGTGRVSYNERGPS